MAEKYRVRRGHLHSDTSDGNNGCFIVPFRTGQTLRAIATDGMGWEHVSVSLTNRCPNWPEMCFIKAIFWRDDETVVQYHPPRSEYVNHHPYTLHLWRPSHGRVELPPALLVGPRDALNPTDEERAAMRAWAGKA